MHDCPRTPCIYAINEVVIVAQPNGPIRLFQTVAFVLVGCEDFARILMHCHGRLFPDDHPHLG
jgi:hypothetical protein